MKALHVNWTKPSGNEYFAEDFELLTTILSALKWREKNGNIKMITDKVGFEFYKSKNMLDIWDEVDVSLDDMPLNINPQMFWAAGKLYAAKTNKEPFAMLDTDFIVWDRLAFESFGDLAVIHDEEINNDVYPDIHHFDMKYGYIFNPELDWREKPFNTAFYVMKNSALAEEYTKEAFSFMENANSGDNLTYMVFAEQRLLAMVAKKQSADVKIISNLERLFVDGEKYFTHVWGMKQQMRELPQLRYDYIQRCIRRIKSDFPEYESLIKNIIEG